MKIEWRAIKSLVAVVLLLASGAAFSQADYPSKPVRLVVGFPPGGGTDIIARALAQGLSTALGQPVTVENRAGAGGVVGSQVVKEAAPDGYTLLAGSTSTQVVAPLLFAKPPFTAADFTPVAHVAGVDIILVANPSAPFNDFRSFIQYAKKNPGRMDYASGGNGVTNHLAMELVKARAGVYLVHIPYRGSAPAMQDVMGGRIPVMFDSVAAALPQVRAGRVKALALAKATRSDLLPNVPTIAEAGREFNLAGFDASGWVALYGPRGLPPAVLKRLDAATEQTLKNADVASRFASQGAGVRYLDSAAMTKYEQDEVNKWGEAIKYSGAKQD
jgi:tripartite-type tricarboxylate transporter receptor subunit TctC